MAFHHEKQSDWEAIFNAQHDRFLFAATTLLTCNRCAREIITEARSLIQEVWISRDFQVAFALRTIVRLAITHRLKYPEGLSATQYCDHKEIDSSVSPPLCTLPFLERAVYFLREILGYSRRDTCLMIGMYDSHVDQLLELARARMPNGLSDSIREWYRQNLLPIDLAETHDPT